MKNLFVKYDGRNNKYVVELDGVARINLKSSIGSKCLYLLVKNAGRSYNPTVLRALISQNIEIPQDAIDEFELKSSEEQYYYLIFNTFIPTIDMKTLLDVRKRIKKIEEELLEADRNNDLKGKDDLISEKEFCESYLSNALNQNGTIKNLNKHNRNATKSIQRGLEEVIEDINFQSQEIYDILKKSIIKTSNQIKFVGLDQELKRRV